MRNLRHTIHLLAILCFFYTLGRSNTNHSNNGMTVDCGPLSTPVTLDCINKIPEIPDEFLNSATILNTDILAFELLGGSINNPCGPVIITAEDVVVQAGSGCTDTQIIDRVYTINDGTTTLQCITTYTIEYKQLQLLGHAKPITVDCEENVDSILNAWIERVGDANIQGCGTISQIIPANPIIAFDSQCNNNDPSIPNQRGNIRVQWYLTEDCTNATTITTIASFIVVDNTPPEITCPNDQTFNINNPDLETDILDHLENYDAFEQCGEARVNNDFTSSLIAYDCNPLQVIPITFSARDTCNNVTSCITNISIENNTGPTITCPNDFTLECGNPNNLALVNNWKVDAQARDYTGMAINVMDDFDETLLQSPFCGQSTTILFSAADFCGRSENCTAVITIEDTKSPILSCPNDTIFFSSEPDIVQASLDWVNSSIVDDACNNFNITNNLDTDEVLFSCSTEKFVNVEFIAEDFCGNDTSCVSTIIVRSDYASEINCGNDLIIECGDTDNPTIIGDWLNSVTAFDNTGMTFPINNNLDLNNPNLTSCDGNILVAFIAEDQCGTIRDCNARILLQDTTIPEIICPDDITIVSGNTNLEDDISNWRSSITSTDNCGSVSYLDNYDPSSIVGCDLSITVAVEFTGTDECGLMSVPCESNLTIETDRIPSVTCPLPLFIDCGNTQNESIIATWISTSEGFDFTGQSLNVSNTYSIGALDFMQCEDSLEVSFSVIDNCNWSDVCQAMIYVRDTIVPEIICPTPLGINTSDPNKELLIKNWVSTVTTSDNCLSADYTFDLDTSQLDLCTTTPLIVVNYLTTDACGNTNACNTEININASAPSLSCPTSTLDLQCGDPNNEDLINNWIAEASANDNNNLNLVVDNNYDPLNLIGDCFISTDLTFSAIDTCGFMSECIGTITLSDNISPNIDCPTELNLIAGDPDILGTVEDFLLNIPIEDCNTFERTDDLDRSLLDFDCGTELTIPVLFTAVDSCSNSSDCQFDIIIRNTVVSDINCPSYELSLECGDPAIMDSIDTWLALTTAEDNMGNAFPVENDFYTSGHNLLECSSEITVEFVMVDQCNTGLNCFSIIRINDTTVPEISCPSDTAFIFGTPTFDTDIINYLNSANASDNCGSTSTSGSYDTNYMIDDCLGFVDLAVTFTTIDDCGLRNTCASTMTIQSDRAARIECPNTPLVLECGEQSNLSTINNWLDIDGFDFDGNALIVTNDYQQIDFDNLECGDALLVTFTMTNSCNIDITCDQNISLEDNQAPTINCPNDITVEGTDPNALNLINQFLNNISANDECSAVAIEEFSNADFSDLCSFNNVEEIRFVATDECQLTSECIATVTVNNETPTIVCPQDDLVLECGNTSNNGLIAIWIDEAFASDNSGTSLNVVDDFSSLNLQDPCNNTTAVEFRVEDSCGGNSSCVKSITLIDETAPTITCPADISISLFANDIQSQLDSWLLNGSAIDDCQGLVDVNAELSVDLMNLECGDSFDVAFSTIDICGNDDLCFSNVTFVNDATVSIDCPSPITIKCSEVFSTISIDSFLNSYSAFAEDDFEVFTDFDINSVNSGCVESFTQIVTFEIIDACNNKDACESAISFLPDGKIYIPNTFSPDGDGNNDWFTVYANESIESVVSMNIYNRWGVLVFSAENFPPNEEKMGWDGFYRSDLGQGDVYVYQIEVMDSFGNIIRRIGNVTLLE